MLANNDLHTYRAYVTKVYDGDTVTLDIYCGFGIVLKKQVIRLIRINTPEVRGNTKEAGIKSRDALRERILNKWVVLKTYKDKKGKFGRWLGEVWIDDECINDWLLNEGYAKPY
jgi:micrococcal nuclease